MTSKHLLAGQRAEDEALATLRKNGLRLVARNYRCAMGELDLVMNDHGVVVFVEVRYRKTRHFGNAAETINRAKQQRLIKAAQAFLQQHAECRRLPARFDVVAMHDDAELEWIKDAFQELG